MISVHNVPYALKCIRNILPAHISRSNSVSCSTASLICIPHFFYNSDLLHKKSGPSPGKTGSCPRHAEILAGRAASDDVHRWQVGTIEFCDIPDMDHVRESQPSDFDGKRFDLACPQRGDAVMDRCQRKTADPIKETPHGGHQIIPSACPEAVTCSISAGSCSF